MGGLVCAGACVISACLSTTKVKPIIETVKEERDMIRKCRELKPDEYTEKDMRKDLVVVYGKATWSLVKLYSIPLATAVLSTTSILAGCHILKARNAALAAAYLTLDKSYKSYRKRVAERFGEDVERQIRSGVKLIASEGDSNAEQTETGITKLTGVVSSDGLSDYARVFDQNSCCWRNNETMNLSYLKGRLEYWNSILRSRRTVKTKDGEWVGLVFLNEVCDDLDVKQSEAGQIVGWTYYHSGHNPYGDNNIDFNIHEVWNPDSDDKTIILDFNVDGSIINLLDKI